MAKKMRNGLTQKQRKTQVRRVAEAIDIYEIRPNRPMTESWENYPDPAESPVELGLAFVADVKPLLGRGSTSTVCQYCGEPDGRHTGQCPTVSFGGAS